MDAFYVGQKLLQEQYCKERYLTNPLTIASIGRFIEWLYQNGYKVVRAPRRSKHENHAK